MYMALEVALDVLFIRINHVTYVIGELMHLSFSITYAV